MPTARQQAIFDFIAQSLKLRGLAPSYGEIQEKFRFKSVTAVAGHLKALETKGLIKREPGRYRAISLVHPPEDENLRSIPIFGSIPAGMPSDQRQGDEGCIKVDLDNLKIPKGARVFALKVSGDSMIGAGILDKDIVILEYRGSANNGDIVAALVDGETTLKRYMVQRGKPFLKAENPKYYKIVPANELVIQGTMIGLWRGY